MSRASRFVGIATALVPASAWAWESEPQDIVFTDETDIFAAAGVDSGYLPENSPVAVRFFIDSDGGVLTEMGATSQVEWPTVLTHRIDGTPGTGWFALISSLTAAAEIKVDLDFYTDTFDIWSESLEFEAETAFDPILLPGAPTEHVEVASDSQGLDPFEYSYEITTGVELNFRLEVFPRANAALDGLRMETGESVIEQAGQAATVAVPQDPGSLDLATTFVGWLDASLEVVFLPTVELCLPFVGCSELFSTEMPLAVIDVSEEHPFAPVGYSHPLPALESPETSHDFGAIEIGNTANLELPLTSIGLLDLEGTAHIEGDGAFSVFPEYFYASPESTDGVVVSFSPDAEGQGEAVLVIDSNDPLQPRIEIALTGNGEVRESVEELGETDVSAELRACGCSAVSTPGGAMPWMSAIAGLLLFRRRNRA